MKHSQIYTIFFIIFSLISIPIFHATAQSLHLRFSYGSWNQIVQKAQREGKLIFVDTYSPSCYPCKVMEKGAFKDRNVALLYNEKFINYKINMADERNMDFQAKYEIFELPTLLYFNEDGQLLRKETGGQNIQAFLRIGKEVIDNVHQRNNEIIASMTPSTPSFRTKPKEKPKEHKVKNSIQEETNLPPISPDTPITAPPPPISATKAAPMPPPPAPKKQRPTPKIVKNNPPPPPPAPTPPPAPPAQQPSQDTHQHHHQQHPMHPPQYASYPPQQQYNAVNAQPPIFEGAPVRPIQPIISTKNNLPTPQQRLVDLTAEYHSSEHTSELLYELAYLSKKYYRPYNMVVNEYLQSQHNNLDSEENRAFVYDFSINLENRAIDIFLNDIHYFKETHGSKEINERLTDAIHNSILVAIRERDYPLFEKAQAIVENIDLPNKEAFLFEIRSIFYQGTEDWDTYADLVTKYFRSRDITDPVLLGDVAWAFHQYIHDGKRLKRALRWIEASIQIENEYYNNHIYAALLYKIGAVDDAIEAAKKAIAIAKMRRVEFDETIDLLNRIYGR